MTPTIHSSMDPCQTYSGETFVSAMEYEEISDDENDDICLSPKAQKIAEKCEEMENTCEREKVDFLVDGGDPKKFVGFVSKRTVERFTEMSAIDMLKSQETFCEMAKTLLSIANKIKGPYLKLIENFKSTGEDGVEMECKACFHCFPQMRLKSIKPQGRPTLDSKKPIDLSERTKKTTSVKRLKKQAMSPL